MSMHAYELDWNWACIYVCRNIALSDNEWHRKRSVLNIVRIRLMLWNNTAIDRIDWTFVHWNDGNDSWEDWWILIEEHRRRSMHKSMESNKRERLFENERWERSRWRELIDKRWSSTEEELEMAYYWKIILRYHRNRIYTSVKLSYPIDWQSLMVGTI